MERVKVLLLGENLITSIRPLGRCDLRELETLGLSILGIN
jgi:hypothetical protein